MKHNTLFATIASLALSVSAIATTDNSDKYIVGSGSDGKAYHTMMTNVAGKCPNAKLEVKINTKGSLGNLSDLNRKEIDLGVMQSDVLALAILENPLANQGLRAVVGLHNEEVHIVALPDFLVGKNMIGRGGRAPATLADLAGEEVKIGAWGGSLKTADSLNRLIMPKRAKGWKATLVQLDAPDDKVNLVQRMRAAKVDVVVMVSGKPDGTLDKMPQGAVRLLSVDAEIAKANPNFFTTASLEYNNLSVQTVPTIAVQALLVSRFFDDPADIERITGLRECIHANLSTFKNRRGFHPKWNEVDLKIKVDLPKFQFAERVVDVPATSPAQTKKK